MRTISTSIAAALVISVVTAARAAPLDCNSTRLSAMELTKCFPGLIDSRPRQPVDSVPSQKAAPSGGREGADAPPEAAPALRQSAPPTSSLKVDVFCGYDEAECMKQLAGMARRDGDHLRLMLANGQAKTLTTTRQACEADIYEKCLIYRLKGYFARHRQFLVDVGFLGHGGTTFLVSRRTGSHIRLDAAPLYSPAGKRLAAVSATESDGENSIEIWTAGDPPRSEWRYTVPKDEYALYQFIGWDGEERLKMTVTTRIDGQLHDSLPVEAVRTSDGWKLMPPAPKQWPR
jgi:hypothetical protein